jgi:hypothetical protein
MNNSRLSQWAPLTGVVAAVLIVLGGIMTGMGDYLPPANEVVASLVNNSNAPFGVYLGELSAFFLFWFAGSLRSALHEQENEAGQISTVAFGGGVAAGVVLLVVFASASAALGRAGALGGISTEGAVTLHELRSALLGEALPVSLAIMVGAAALAAFYTKAFPAWFGWLSGVVALICLSPIGFAGQIAALVWIAAVSIWLAVRRMSKTAMVAAAH